MLLLKDLHIVASQQTLKTIKIINLLASEKLKI